jgi:hypothetical protein
MGSEEPDRTVKDLTSQPIAATPGDSASAHNLVNGRHLNPIHVWAAGSGAPLRFGDNDARLPNQGGGDQPFGQDNWLVSFEFTNFSDLANKLGGKQFDLPSFACDNSWFRCGPIEENQITRLAILAHGAPGGVDIDNKSGWDIKVSVSEDSQMLNAGTIVRYSNQFDQILNVLAYRAKVFFMCCRTGSGKEGDEFLKAVSRRWESKEIFVVGYKSILYSGAQRKKGAQGVSCYPGVRETHYSNHKEAGFPTRYYETPSAWNDLGVLPWATESTPHATVAWRGMIMRNGVEANFDGTAPSR